MTATELSGPSPAVTARLAEHALSVYSSGIVDDAAAAALAETLPSELAPAESDGAATWAGLIAADGGSPLLGTTRTAPTYPALMWNGARLAAAAPGRQWAPLLAAVAAAAADADPVRVGRAVIAGEAVLDDATELLGADPVAYPTLATLAAATAASLAGPAEGADLVDVLDLAASLQLFVPDAEHASTHGWTAGHAAASGWLAAALPADAITPMPGSVAHTLSAAAGRAVPTADIS
ncbi:hypothetical protein AAFP35_15870 [Gordonia sp. CPCC 206044]|uniref:hypothetical protein n=1 Tax=Gordonia sp. CPCC 206044 TaxID=3140793 RepID=UPI003AF352EE